MTAREKVLLVRLNCGHTLVFGKADAPRSGNTVECRHCHYKSRTVIERSWVSAKTSGDES